MDGLSQPQRIATMHTLLSENRTGSLSTLNDGAPFGSMVPFLWHPESATPYIHVSRLARHTRHMGDDPRVALLITEADGPDKNPLALIRTCISGSVTRVGPQDEGYGLLKARYLERFPTSAMIFQLPDFAFYGITPEQIHLVAGFGMAYTIAAADLIGS